MKSWETDGSILLRFDLPATRFGLLVVFQQSQSSNLQSANRLESVSDEELHKSWSLLNVGATIMTMPRIAVIRTSILNHTFHYRAHLCVYLRMNDIPVPALYGPSGDER